MWEYGFCEGAMPYQVAQTCSQMATYSPPIYEPPCYTPLVNSFVSWLFFIWGEMALLGYIGHISRGILCVRMTFIAPWEYSTARKKGCFFIARTEGRGVLSTAFVQLFRGAVALYTPLKFELYHHLSNYIGTIIVLYCAHHHLASMHKITKHLLDEAQKSPRKNKTTKKDLSAATGIPLRGLYSRIKNDSFSFNEIVKLANYMGMDIILGIKG